MVKSSWPTAVARLASELAGNFLEISRKGIWWPLWGVTIYVCENIDEEAR